MERLAFALVHIGAQAEEYFEDPLQSNWFVANLDTALMRVLTPLMWPVMNNPTTELSQSQVDLGERIGTLTVNLLQSVLNLGERPELRYGVLQCASRVGGLYLGFAVVRGDDKRLGTLHLRMYERSEAAVDDQYTYDCLVELVGELTSQGLLGLTSLQMGDSPEPFDILPDVISLAGSVRSPALIGVLVRTLEEIESKLNEWDCPLGDGGYIDEEEEVEPESDAIDDNEFDESELHDSSDDLYNLYATTVDALRNCQHGTQCVPQWERILSREICSPGWYTAYRAFLEVSPRNDIEDKLCKGITAFWYDPQIHMYSIVEALLGSDDEYYLQMLGRKIAGLEESLSRSVIRSMRTQLDRTGMDELQQLRKRFAIVCTEARLRSEIKVRKKE